MKTIFFENRLELEYLRNSIVYYEQLIRCYFESELMEILEAKVIDGSILNIKFLNDEIRISFIVSLIAMFKVKRVEYKAILDNFLQAAEKKSVIKYRLYDACESLVHLLTNDDLFYFYELGNYLALDSLYRLLRGYNLSDSVTIIDEIWEIINERKESLEGLKYTQIFNECLQDALRTICFRTGCVKLF